MTGVASARPTRKGTTEQPRGPDERQRRIEQSTRRPKRGGKILTMRQLRKMASTLARRMYREASNPQLKPQDQKQCTVSFSVLTDKLVLLAPHDKHGQIADDGSPEIRAAMQELGVRIAAAAQAQAQRRETA